MLNNIQKQKIPNNVERSHCCGRGALDIHKNTCFWRVSIYPQRTIISTRQRESRHVLSASVILKSASEELGNLSASKGRVGKTLLTRLKTPGELSMSVLPKGWFNWIKFFYSLPESGIECRSLVLRHKPQNSSIIPKYKHHANVKRTIYFRNSVQMGSISYSAKDLDIYDPVMLASPPFVFHAVKSLFLVFT